MNKLRVLDLFSGIGGFSLGLERTGGFETVAFCEIEPYCRAVLAKHWPSVKQYHDVRTLTADVLRSDGITVDVICGGFPCQDISAAGLQAGITGERSGLWRDYARLIGELRPRLAIVENVAALSGRGLANVLGDLAGMGFDAEWFNISASNLGSPHHRARVWIVAHPEEIQRQHQPDTWNAIRRGLLNDGHAWDECPWSATASAVCRVDDGIPDRVDRSAALGNAVVPQIPELIGRAILEAEGLTP